MRETLKIIVCSILLVVIYGILHDLVTAHISVEYFTVGHQQLIESQSPVLLALLWGVLATWWVGLLLGIALAFAARFGSAPKLGATKLLPSMIYLLGVMALSALVAGIVGYITAQEGAIHLVPRLASQISPERHDLFLTAGWSHGASYAVGFIGGVFLCLRIWLRRRKEAQLTRD